MGVRGWLRRSGRCAVLVMCVAAVASVRATAVARPMHEDEEHQRRDQQPVAGDKLDHRSSPPADRPRTRTNRTQAAARNATRYSIAATSTLLPTLTRLSHTMSPNS